MSHYTTAEFGSCSCTECLLRRTVERLTAELEAEKVRALNLDACLEADRADMAEVRKERDSWKRRFADLDAHRGHCCYEMERERDELRAEVERLNMYLAVLLDDTPLGDSFPEIVRKIHEERLQVTAERDELRAEVARLHRVIEEPEDAPLCSREEVRLREEVERLRKVEAAAKAWVGWQGDVTWAFANIMRGKGPEET